MKTNRLLYFCFPYLLLLLCADFFFTGCSKDGEGTDLPERVANVTITTQGVVVDTPQDENLDDYVKSIRVIVFNAGNIQVWNKRYTVSTVSGVIQWNQEAVQVEAQLTPGSYTLYIIANEDGYNLASNGAGVATSLIQTLTKTGQAGKSSLTSTELEDLVIQYQNPTVDSPILMTAKERVLLSEGDNSFKIPLVRTLAKLSRVNVAKGAYPSDNPQVSSLKGTFSLTVKMMDRFPLFGNTISSVQPTTTKTIINGTLAEEITGVYFPPTSILIDNMEATPTGEKTYTLVKNEKIQFPVSQNDALILNAMLLESSCLQLNIGYQEWVPKELGPTYE